MRMFYSVVSDDVLIKSAGRQCANVSDLGSMHRIALSFPCCPRATSKDY